MKAKQRNGQAANHGAPPGAFLCLAVWLLGFLALPAAAQVIALERPGEREFIIDRADLITPQDEQRIEQICDRLLTDTASPIIVVTIESMAAYSKRGELPWETFSRVLFDQWGIGHLQVGGQSLNTGILVLISRDDRKARIELGVGWSYDKEALTQQIMSQVMVPQFKRGEFSQGIVAAVEALDQMARGQRPVSSSGGGQPSPAAGGGSRGGGGGGGMPGGLLAPLLSCGGPVGLIILFVLSRVLGGGLSRLGRRNAFGLYPSMYGGGLLGGGGGWGGGGGGGGGRSFGGGFSGGSFGGGFSGGRGASGSW